MLHLHPNPLLCLAAIEAQYTRTIGEMCSPPWLRELLRTEAESPVERSEALRSAVRDLLRAGGFKPSGRNKPSSEYLVKAATSGRLASINPAVDICNGVSLHSGLPVSVIDLERAQGALRVEVAPTESTFVFNPSGQVIDVSGLVGLSDASGPCANPVKDAQRTKTHVDSSRTLTLIWGVRAHEAQTRHATDWYLELLQRLGCEARELPLK